MFAHRVHAFGKGFDAGKDADIFEILHDLVTKRDGVNIVQGHIKKGLQVIFLLAGRDAGDDLVEIEIDKKLGRDRPLFRNTVGGAFK